MRINYFSDIHLEFGLLKHPKTTADIVIAAGDIGVRRQGINWLKGIDKPVIYIAGNHEFYTHEYQRTLKMLQESCAHSNIHFLEKQSVIINNVRFLGCTLWTDLFSAGQEKANEIGMRLNDFKNIYFHNDPFNEDSFTLLYRTSILWLEEALNQPFTGKTVVISHHAPSWKSWNDPNNQLKRLAYCNFLDRMIEHANISAWFHGHVHSVNDYRIANTRILSNARGYKNRREVKEFNLNKVVDI